MLNYNTMFVSVCFRYKHKHPPITEDRGYLHVEWKEKNIDQVEINGPPFNLMAAPSLESFMSRNRTNSTRNMDVPLHNIMETSTIYEPAGPFNGGNVLDRDRNEEAQPATEERPTGQPSTESKTTIYELAGPFNGGNVADRDRNEAAQPATEERPTAQPSTESEPNGGKDKTIGLYRKQSSNVPYREDVLSCEELKNILKRTTAGEIFMKHRYENVPVSCGNQSNVVIYTQPHFGSSGSSIGAHSVTSAHTGGDNLLVKNDSNTIESEQEQ